ncbi:hypothetical protein L7F22_024978 [Adiantum nelumboides]|nr:hypothetical protein [Adiantum nelumboides]
MQLPRKPRLDAVRRILRYVRATLDYALFYDTGTQVQVHGYTDSDWAGSSSDRRSTSGYMFSFGSAAVTWSSKKQPTVALSSIETEFRGATVAVCEVAWLEMLFRDLEIQVCTICTFRFFGLHGAAYLDLTSVKFLLEWIDSHILKELKEEQEGSALLAEQSSDGKKCQGVRSTAGTGNPCVACLGIFQCFELTTEFAESSFSLSKANIIEAVKERGYQFDSFSLEITVPGVVFVRERAVWQYLQDVHGSQSVLQGKHLSEHVVSLKEALKWALIKPLQEALQAVYDCGSTFKIVLLYKHPETVSQLGFPGCSLKRKRKEGSGDCTEPVESLAAIQRCLASLSCKDFNAIYSIPPAKCEDACKLDVSCHRTSIFIGGRYLKYSRNVSQSPWLIDEDRKGAGSVQEVIADVVFPPFKGDSYKFHASGREDIDVRMLGRGRPFMVEIINAPVLPAKAEIQKLEGAINNLKEGWVNVRNLQYVGNDARIHMLEGESEKQVNSKLLAKIWCNVVFKRYA